MDYTLVEEWLIELEQTGRKSSTIQRYRWTVCKMLRTLEENGRPTDPDKITRDDIMFLNNTYGGKEHVIKMDLAMLSRYVKYHTGRNIIKETNILYNSPQYERIWIDAEQFWRLYTEADPSARMMLVLGAFMGLRRSEIIDIRDNDLKDGCMTVRGKGHGKNGKVVSMHIPKIVEEEIVRYRQWKKGFESSGDGHLLQIPNQKNKGRLTRISRMTVSKRFLDLSKSTGIHVTCHSLRRLFATTLYFDIGCDELTLKTLMRHEQVATTFQCYILPREQKTVESMDRLSSYMESVKI